MGRLDDVTELLFAHNSINTDEINDISDFSPKLWQSIHGVLQMAVNTHPGAFILPPPTD